MNAEPPVQRRSVSITHEHIFTTIRTLVADGTLSLPERRLRVLDIGCGDGLLIDYLTHALPAAFPGISVEVHGFDIGEQGYRDGDQKSAAQAMLEARHPDVDWSGRLKLLSDHDHWGYPEGFFDVAVSNQVVEHVEDLRAFLFDLRGAVRVDGASIHLFPLKSCIPEAHCLVPFAHWISDFDHRVAWIALMSCLGIGRFRHDRRVLGHADERVHAVETAKYIQCWTSYRSFDEIAKACYGLGLGVSYHFTKDFFFAKARRMVRRPQARRYRRWNWLGLEWLSFLVGRYLSSSTLIIRPLSYDIGRRIAAEKAAAQQGQMRALEPA